MRAIVIARFGGPEVLREMEIREPQAGPGEILVRVRATSVNPVDAKVRQSGSWAGITMPAVLGYDASGTVEAAGPGVTEFAVGDEVYYTPEIFGNSRGTYAELNVVPAAIAARMPTGLSHEQAASRPFDGSRRCQYLGPRGGPRGHTMDTIWYWPYSVTRPRGGDAFDSRWRW